jgi:hypothetical protein
VCVCVCVCVCLSRRPRPSRSDGAIEAIFLALDTNESGSIDIEEFLTWFNLRPNGAAIEPAEPSAPLPALPRVASLEREREGRSERADFAVSPTRNAERKNAANAQPQPHTAAAARANGVSGSPGRGGSPPTPSANPAASGAGYAGDRPQAQGLQAADDRAERARRNTTLPLTHPHVDNLTRAVV